MATMDEEYNDLANYIPGAQILPGWAPITPLNEFIRDVGLRRSVNIGDVPVVGAAGDVFGLTDESGEARLGNILGMDDYARMNRALSQGDYGQAAISGLTGLGEVGLLASGIGKVGQGVVRGGMAGVKGLTGLFGRGAAEAAPAAATRAATGAAGAGDSVIARIVQNARAGAQGTAPAAATRPTLTDRIPIINRIPRRFRWLAVPAAIAASAVMGDDTATTTQPYVPSTAPGSITAPAPVDNRQTYEQILADRQAAAREAILRDRQSALRGFGAAERAALDEYLNTISDATSGQSEAVRQQSRELAGLLSQDVGAIEGMGAAGSQAANRRYRQAARRARREGRQEQVASGVGGLTPVSGAIADMPRNLRGRGADLSSYISDNAAIAARDAGFDAASAVEYGNAVANQFAQEMALMGNQQRYQTETALAQQRRDLASQYNRMLTELELQGVSDQADLAMTLAREEADREASSLSAPALLASPAGAIIGSRWSEVENILAGNVQDIEQSTVDYARDIADFLNARYGAVNRDTFAQMFVDYPQMLTSLVEGQ